MQRLISGVCGIAVFGLIVITTIASAKATYMTTVTADNPVGYWRLDDASGSTAVASVGSVNGDYVNTAYVGYGQTGALTASGETNKSVGFTGTGTETNNPQPTASYLTISNSVFSGVGTGAFSIQFWFKPNTVTRRGDLLVTDQYDSSSHELGVLITEKGKLHIAYNKDANRNNIDSDATLTANTWYQFTLVRSSGSVSIYLNDQVVLDKTYAWDYSKSTGNKLYVGTNYDKDYDSNCDGFNGLMDEVSVYNYALSANQIAAHYTAAITAVPEPNAALLFSSGVVGLLAYAWRKRSKN